MGQFLLPQVPQGTAPILPQDLWCARLSLLGILGGCVREGSPAMGTDLG